MLMIGEITYLYFLVIDGEVELLEARSDRLEDPASVYLDRLNSEYKLAPNWEAVGAQTVIINREDLPEIQLAIPFAPLYDIKVMLTDMTRDYSRDVYGRTMFNEFELQAWKHGESVGIVTLGRDENAQWVAKESPVNRAVNARSTPLGIPGGPCHIIRNIEEENIPDRVKKDLIEDIEKGRKIDKADENLLYDTVSIPSKVDLFKRITLTSHAQFRMDQRGVTVPEMQKALDEFSRWFNHRKKNPHAMKPKDQSLFQDMAYGEPVRFDARKEGLTLVLVVDQKRSEARIISTWWSNQPNPPKPKPGQCDFIPYLDKERGQDRPKILGGSVYGELLRTAKKIRQYVDGLNRTAGCGGSCGCGCDGNCDDCSCKDGSFSVSEEPMILPSDWDEGQEDDFLYAEAPLSDPGSRYEDTVEDEELKNTILTEEQEEDFDEGVDAVSKGRKYHDRKPVKNRSENRERRRDYERNPTQKRKKQLQQRKYDRGRGKGVSKRWYERNKHKPPLRNPPLDD